LHQSQGKFFAKWGGHDPWRRPCTAINVSRANNVEKKKYATFSYSFSRWQKQYVTIFVQFDSLGGDGISAVSYVNCVVTVDH